MPDLKKRYYDWLLTKCGYNYEWFSNLLQTLHSTAFRYVLPIDANRAEDGRNLRYLFATEIVQKSQKRHINTVREAEKIEKELTGECSILELLVALSIRCEDIMDNTEIGDRTTEWFWRMISNLGLSGMTNDKFDEAYVHDVLERFMNREYGPDGEGGLFYVRSARYDMRSVDIWTQMLWYIDKVII